MVANGDVNCKRRTHGRTDQTCDVKKVLANSEPSTHGAFGTSTAYRSTSARRATAGLKKFHNTGSAKHDCSSKAKMSALSKVEMSLSPPFWEFGGCHFDGHGGDEQARADASTQLQRYAMHRA